MTVFTVVESLPTSDIENKVYLVKSSLTSDKNIYSEYIYIGNRNGVYDATKWEKLGEVAAKTDLSEYYKKTEVYNKDEIDTKVTTLNTNIAPLVSGITANPHLNIGPTDPNKDTYELTVKYKNGTNNIVHIKPATNTDAGVMTNAQKIKLDGIAVGANKTVIDAVMSTTSTNAVQNKVIDNAIKTHKIDGNNLTGKWETDGIEYWLLGQGDTGDGKVSALTDTLTYQYNPSTHSSLSIDGSDVWDASTLTALTDTELNNILK
nr:MAG TPA: hypothetical protein [Caudoviricetes sp.]